MTKRPGQAGYKHCLQNNRPPENQAWLWITAEMMESEAWGALTAPALRVVTRVMLEHMHHGGTENGNLPVTYDDFEKFRIDRHSIRSAVAVAEALGFIDVVERGVKGYGMARRPSLYALTWLPRQDDIKATNRWKSIKTADDAKAATKRALERKGSSKTARAKRPPSERCSERAPSPSPLEIFRVVGESPLEKTQQNDAFQWGKAHWTSGVNNTHSSGENSTGEKSVGRPGITAPESSSRLANGTSHPIDDDTTIPLPERLETNFLE